MSVSMWLKGINVDVQWSDIGIHSEMHGLSACPSCIQRSKPTWCLDSALLTIVRVYKLYLLTYLLIQKVAEVSEWRQNLPKNGKRWEKVKITKTDNIRTPSRMKHSNANCIKIPVFSVAVIKRARRHCSKASHQQNPPVLSKTCLLMQLDLYNGCKTVVVVAVAIWKKINSSWSLN